MSRASQNARAEAQSSERGAREQDWPLPVRGIRSEARRSEFNGSTADVMLNWQPSGSALRMRDGYVVQDATSARQRIPYEFGLAPDYITIDAAFVRFKGVRYYRPTIAEVYHATISSNVIMVGGGLPIIRCDGTSIVAAGFTTTTGKNPDDFDRCFSHHDRMYFWSSWELDFYYGDVGAVTGTLTRFPLSRLGNITGSIKIMSSMSVSAGNGISDTLVIMTTTGMVVIYEGLDPGDATSWALMARISTECVPVSGLAVLPFGSDLWILTSRGVLSIRDSMAQGAVAMAAAVTAPISDLIAADVSVAMGFYGWSMSMMTDQMDIVVNVPGLGFTYKQYIFSVAEQAWSTANYPAVWWSRLLGRTDFVRPDGTLCRITKGADDAGTPITATFHTSWVRIPGGASLAYVIPTIIGTGAMSVTVTLLVDHNQTDADIAESTQVITVSPDVAGHDAALNQIIGAGSSGRVHQARFTVSGNGVTFENIQAGLM